jgi:short-subunit dehydrogenase
MLNPKHILITGASSGIGAALALLYAMPGVRLSLHGRNAGRLAAVAESAKERAAAVTMHTDDVTDAAAMAAWINTCDALQPIDLVIVNAGISAGAGGGLETTEQVRAVFATNVNGVLNTVQPALPLMINRRRGQIAIMSSVASFHGFPGAASYCASKAAVRTYGEGLRGDMAPRGVEVNVICPGFIKTPMTDVNPFPMPFIMSAERAARIIRSGLERNRARIAFPWPMYMGIRLLAALPQGLIDRLVARTPRKPGIG